MKRRTFTALPLIAITNSVMAITNQNKPLSDLAGMFFQDRETPTFGSEHLKPELLDFSLDSLKHVDDYLEIIRKDSKIAEHWNRVVLRTGAYLGEVIRKNCKTVAWQWIGHHDAASIAPEVFKDIPVNIATAAVLHDGKTGLAFPLAKVEKYLANGSEDSVHFFADVIINK